MCVRFSLFGIAIKFKWFRVRTISIVSLAIFKCAISSPLAAAKKTTTTKTTCQQQPQLTHKSFSSGKCKLCNSQKMLPCNFCCHIFVVATLFSFAYLCFIFFVFCVVFFTCMLLWLPIEAHQVQRLILSVSAGLRSLSCTLATCRLRPFW